MSEILIYEVIGEDFFGGGMSAKRFLDELKAIGHTEDVTVRINSPGGNVYDGDAIYNALNRHKGKVTIEVDGLAASAASYIAMAGDEIRMAENAIMMIHKAMTITIGNASDHAKTGDYLEKVDSAIAGIYSKRTGRRAETFLKMMADETYFTADEAVENKLADSIIPNKKIAAHWDARAVANFKRAEEMQRFIVPVENRKPSAELLAARLKEVA